jgi:hypothetical protein
MALFVITITVPVGERRIRRGTNEVDARQTRVETLLSSR